MSKREDLKIIKTGRLTKAIISKTEDDATNRVLNRLGLNNSKAYNKSEFDTINKVLNLDLLKMNTKYSGSVTCDEEDTYDDKTGRSLAVKKLMRNHNKAFNKALEKWQASMLRKIYEVNPSTFDDAYYNTFSSRIRGGFVNRRD